jgi:hypothetical protein
MYTTVDSLGAIAGREVPGIDVFSSLPCLPSQRLPFPSLLGSRLQTARAEQPQYI